LRRRGRRRKQLLDDLNEKRRYWNLKEETLGHTPWRTGFGSGYWLVARQATVLIKIINMLHSYTHHVRVL